MTADALHSRAAQCLGSGQLAQAQQLCLQALQLQPGHAASQHLMGHLAARQGQWLQALQWLQRAQQAGLVSAGLQAELGSVLRQLGHLDAALQHYEASLALQPAQAVVHYNKGNLLRQQRRNEEAVACFKQAITLQPGLAQAWSNLGNALEDLDRYAEARDAYQQALTLMPQLKAAQYNLGLCQLQTGELQAGWDNFEARWALPDFEAVALKTLQPRWQSHHTGNTLLIWAEQGLGDEIFWAGLLDRAHELAPTVMVQADARLVPLLRRSFDQLHWVPGRQSLQGLAFDTHMPMGALGAIMRPTLASFDARAGGYLQARPGRVAQLRARLVSDGQRLCGLAWQSKNPVSGSDKSLALHDLLPVLRQPGWRFVNLQYGDVSAELTALMQLHGIEIAKVQDIDNFHDIESLADLVAACDCVVSTSNSTVHLAGALARPVYLLSHPGKGRMWYWLQQRNGRSLWYPTVRIMPLHGLLPDFDPLIKAMNP